MAKQQITPTRGGPTYADGVDLAKSPPAGFNRSIPSKTRQKRPLTWASLMAEIAAELAIYPSDIMRSKRGAIYTLARRLYTGIAMDVMGRDANMVLVDLDASSTSTIRGYFAVYCDLFESEKIVFERGTHAWTMRQLRWMILERYSVPAELQTRRVVK